MSFTLRSLWIAARPVVPRIERGSSRVLLSSMPKTGTADLPLHYGRAPRWLFNRMALLGREITLAIVTEFDVREMLRRLADPCWFQSFGCVLGFDWHSSGVTTTPSAVP